MSEQTLIQAAKELFKLMPDIDRAKHYLSLVEGMRAQFIVSDGDPFYLEIKGGKLKVNKGTVKEPNWTLEGSTPIYTAIFKAQIPMTMAIGVDRLGLIGKGGSLGPLVSMCQEEFRKALVEAAKPMTFARGRDYV